MTFTRFLPVLIIISGLFIACGSGGHKDATEETKTEQAVVINTTHAYICPMRCENSASMEPGVCKVCGMDLVKNPDYKGTTTDTTAAGTDTTTDPHTHDDDGHEGHNH